MLVYGVGEQNWWWFKLPSAGFTMIMMRVEEGGVILLRANQRFEIENQKKIGFKERNEKRESQVKIYKM